MLAGAGSYIRQHHLALIALFVALSGTAYAASKIGPDDIAKNAVRSKHIKNGQVKKADLAAPPRLRQPDYLGCMTGVNWGPWGGVIGTQPIGFERDREGVVHLQGGAICAPPAGNFASTSSNNAIFQLPQGYRPGPAPPDYPHPLRFVVRADNLDNEGNLSAFPDTVFVYEDGRVVPDAAADAVDVSGISFRCTPPGVNGCP